MNLGNLFREIRGKDTLEAMQDKTGVAKQTINKVENGHVKPGDSIKLSTVLKIAAAYKLNREKRLELITAWLQITLGDEFFNFEIHPLQANLKDSSDLKTQIHVALLDLSKPELKAILLAATNKDIRTALLAITSVTKKH